MVGVCVRGVSVSVCVCVCVCEGYVCGVGEGYVCGVGEVGGSGGEARGCV